MTSFTEPLLEINITVSCSFAPSRQISGSYDKIHYLRKYLSRYFIVACARVSNRKLIFNLLQSSVFSRLLCMLMCKKGENRKKTLCFTKEVHNQISVEFKKLF